MLTADLFGVTLAVVLADVEREVCDAALMGVVEGERPGAGRPGGAVDHLAAPLLDDVAHDHRPPAPVAGGVRRVGIDLVGGPVDDGIHRPQRRQHAAEVGHGVRITFARGG